MYTVFDRLEIQSNIAFSNDNGFSWFEEPNFHTESSFEITFDNPRNCWLATSDNFQVISTDLDTLKSTVGNFKMQSSTSFRDINGFHISFEEGSVILDIHSVESLFEQFPNTTYTEGLIEYSSHDEYVELNEHQWRSVVSEVITSTIPASEVIEACDSLEDSEYFTLAGEEYRVLHDDDIFDVYLNAFKDHLRDCYNQGDLPPFLKIDWVASALDVIASDGYAAHFSSYDWSTHIEVGRYNLFRTN